MGQEEVGERVERTVHVAEGHEAVSYTHLDVYKRQDVDLTRERFYELLVEGDEFPTTGQVNPFAFSQAISRAQEAGDDVVILALSSKLSGTHQSAATAASQADGSTEVHVVDTKSVTVGQHILVDYALRLVEEGRSAAEVAAAVEAAADRVCLVALLDTLEYLKRGGRISAAAGTLGERCV